jgi:ABC-type uncharacterized transport system substrate-binding protein
LLRCTALTCYTPHDPWFGLSAMRRGEFITLLGGAAAGWPLAARAQQPMPVVGFLNGSSPSGYGRFLSAFLQGLSEAGYVEGRNVAIEYRWAEGQYDRLPALAADLVRRRVDVIAATSTPANRVAKAATTTIPIVFTTSSDPVELGLVASLSRPGGNVTGAATLNVEVGSKRLELLHEIVPPAAMIVELVNPNNPNLETQLRNLQAAGHIVGRRIVALSARTQSEIDAAFSRLVEQQAGGLLINTDAFFFSQRDQLIALAKRHAIPAIFDRREFAEGRRPDELWRHCYGCVSSGGHLYRSDSQRNQAGRFASPAVHESRAGHQPQDCQGTRPYPPSLAARSRRRGDRIGMLFAAVHESANGT